MTASTPRIRRLAPLLLLSGLACHPADRPAADTAGDVRALVERYQDATNAGDAEALAALYADDALLLPPDGGPVSGHAAILAFWREGIEPGITFEVLESRTDAGGGFVAGRFQIAATETAPADSGKYVLCLVRQRDGAWRVVADIWNATVPEDATDEEDDDPRTRVAAAAHPTANAGVLPIISIKTSKSIAHLRRAR